MNQPNSAQRLQQMVAVASQAMQRGDLLQAERLLKDVLQAAPKAWDVHQALAMVYARQGRHQDAAKQFTRIVNANPAYAPGHANLAIALTESGDPAAAWQEFQRALKIDPAMRPGLLIPMAEALQKLTRHEEAIALYRELLTREKTNHAAFYGMARAYEALEDFPRALECYEHATGLAPDNALYHLRFGSCLRDAKLLGMAAGQYHEAVRCRPEWLDAIVLLAETLQEQRRFDETLECFDRALQLSPDNPELVERRGYALLAQGDSAAAMATFERLLQRDETRQMAWEGLGRSQMEAGQTERAVTSYSETLRRFPHSLGTYYYLAGARKYRADDPLVAEIAARADDVADDENYAIALNFAAGKVMDDSKAWDRAFHYYARGNRLRNRQYQYQAEEDAARVDRDIAVFTPELLERLAPLGSDSIAPVFIVGMPRSGTTLTEQIISSHPQAIGAGEVIFWSEAPTAMPLLQKQEDTPYPQCVELLTQAQIATIADEYLKLLHKITGAGDDVARITDKMPHNFLYLGLIAAVFPRARIVHCKRDPLDNCLSIYFQNFGGSHPYAYDLPNLGHHHVQYQRLMAHWHALLPGRILDLNYEDLIADPEYWSRALIDHVGLDWDDACLAPHKLERTVKTASVWQVRQPIYKSSVQRWKHYEAHLEPLRQVLGL